MTYRVEFTSAAAREVKKLPRVARERVLSAISRLRDDPRPHGATKLVGEQTAWRLRIGDYRVIYDVEDELLTVTNRFASRAAKPGSVHGSPTRR